MADRRELVRLLGRLNASLFSTEDTAASEPAAGRQPQPTLDGSTA
jgi:hypothetical protein